MASINLDKISSTFFHEISKVIEHQLLGRTVLQSSLSGSDLVISSIAQDLISEISVKSGENLPQLSDKDVCILTSILSFFHSREIVQSSEVETILPFVRNVAPYAEAYMRILSSFDKKHITHSSINSCLVEIKELFERNPESKALAIAHWINSRSIILDSIPPEDLDLAIAHIRIALVYSSAIDSVLPDILRKGINIEVLNIKNSSVVIIPTLPKCSFIYLEETGVLKEIESQPECLKFLCCRAQKLEKISALDKCKFFAVYYVPSLKILPASIPCEHFELIGSCDLYKSPATKLENLPDLPFCMVPVIRNCITPISTTPIYGFSVDDSEDFKQKSGYTATCIGFRNTAYGKIYVFSIRDELNYSKLSKRHHIPRNGIREMIEYNMQKLLREKYPALEFSPTILDELLQQNFEIEGSSNMFQLHNLGYSYFEDEASQEIYFTIPSAEALIKTWARLRETYPHLHPLKIQQSEGIASNFDFINSWLAHDILISTKEEFVHDSLAHGIPMFRNITATGYAKDKETICNAIKWALSFIQQARDNLEITGQDYDSLEHLLGYFVDVMSAGTLSRFSRNILSRIQGGEIAIYKEFFTDFFNGQSELAKSPDRFFAGMKNQKLQDDLIIGADLWKKACRALEKKS